MCGILGFTGNKNKRLTKKLLATIQHRGFDEIIYFHSPGINLGMNRLAIVDLRSNLYPMTYKHYVLIYNGEIYNYLGLKKQFLAKKIRFSTRCDAEVILSLFDLFQYKAFPLLEGMFAICIYDKKKKQIILARDKSGQKPLYYLKTPSGFIFSSEVKALISHQKEEFQLNRSTLLQYLTQGFVFGQETLVKKVRKVPPSHCLVYDLKSKKAKLKSYWRPKINSRPQSSSEEKQLISKLDKLIKASVEKRLLSDVPLGCFLSGGVDSSLITYFATQKIKKLKTYSISFPESPRHDEERYSRKVASWLKTQHTAIPCTAKKIKPVIENISQYIDEPIMDPAVLPTFLLAKEARKSVKVVLTGEGADELFGGYYRYHKELLAVKLQAIIKIFPFLATIRNFVLDSKYEKVFTPLAEHYTAQSIWKPTELKQLLLLKNSVLPTLRVSHPHLEQFAVTNPLLAVQLTDYRGYLAEQLLMKIDKITMSNNLEARAPYLDTKIINFALNLPQNEKIRGIHGKYLLKKVVEKYFPKDFTWRLKRGFSVPLGNWFRQELQDIVYQSLEDSKEFSDLLNTKYYTHIVKEHMEKKKNHKDKIWSLIVLTKWLKKYRIST